MTLKNRMLSYRFCLIVLLMSLLCLACENWISFIPRVKAATYNCSAHCAAQQFWPGANYGTYTYLSTAELHCDGAACFNDTSHLQVGFISNEEWTYELNGPNGNNCGDKANGYTQVCWIEVGYTTVNTSDYSIMKYFWADNRPSSTGGLYYEHYHAQISSSDYGHYHGYTISRLTTDTSKWNIIGPGFNEYSTSNPIKPNQIYMGTELVSPNTSTSGAYGGYADWTTNDYVDSGGNYHFQGCGNYGAGLKYMNGAPPPYITYVANPCGSNNGGDIRTWCCNSSGPGYITSYGVPHCLDSNEAVGC